MERKVYNVDEVADILQTSGYKVRALVKNGYLKAFRLGRILIRNEDLDEFLASAVGQDFTDGSPAELSIGGKES